MGVPLLATAAGPSLHLASGFDLQGISVHYGDAPDGGAP